MTGVTHKQVAFVTSLTTASTVMAITLEPMIIVHSQVPELIPLLWIPLSVAGGLAPDIDEPQSKASNFFRRLFVVTTPILILLAVFAFFRNMHMYIIAGAVGALVLTCAIRFISLYTQHRRETHSLFFIALLLIAFFALSLALETIHPWLTLVIWNFGIGFVIGAFSHLLVDNFNKKPLHWLFPIEHIFRNKKTGRLRLYIPTILKIQTGSPREQAFKRVYPAVIICLGLAIIGVYYLLQIL